MQIQATPCSEALLKETMRSSVIGTEMQHQEIQLRIISVLLAGMMLFDFIDPAVFILNVPDSIIARVASLTHEAMFLACSFLALSMAIVPYVVVNIFCPAHQMRREATKLACLGLAGAAMLWFLLAWAARNTDFPYVAGVYMRSGIGAMLFSLSLALSLNNELARTLLDQ